jgi:hypothetical protein
MKSAMEMAFEKVKKLDVQKLEEPKTEKAKKGEISMPDSRPTLYLDEKDFPAIGHYKVGDKVVMVMECTMKSMETYEHMEGKEMKKSMTGAMTVEAMADITKG